MPEPGREGEEAQADPRAEARQGACAVALKPKLALGPEHTPTLESAEARLAEHESGAVALARYCAGTARGFNQR